MTGIANTTHCKYCRKTKIILALPVTPDGPFRKSVPVVSCPHCDKLNEMTNAREPGIQRRSS